MANDPYQLSDLTDFVLTNLNMDQNTVAFTLAVGSGSNNYAITTTDEITRQLNDAKNRLCRNAFLYPMSATLAVTAAGGSSFALNAFTVSGSTPGKLNDVELLTWTPSGGTQAFLEFMSLPAMIDFYPQNVAIPPAGVPTVWTDEFGGLPSVFVPVNPSTNGTLSIVRGYGIPPDFVNSTDPLNWMANDRYLALVYYACACLCRKRVDDANLVARFTDFSQKYDLIAKHIRDDLDPDLAQKYLQPWSPFTPPVPGQGGGAPQGGDSDEGG